MSLGYSDTPVIPGQQWRVHDGARPQPRVIGPTNVSALAPVSAPSDAIVLFDGTNTDAWEPCKTGQNGVGWKLVDGGAMEVVKGTGNICTKQSFGDIQLHVEWMAPAQTRGDGQGRANSGVFLQRKYEVQVLDCYGNPTYPDGTTGALYGQWPPLVNACARPGEWNIYDIMWRAPRFADGKLKSPAVITVLLNGVILHHAKELMGPTMHKVTTSYDKVSDESGQIELQDHGDPVRFRNIWVRELQPYT